MMAPPQGGVFIFCSRGFCPRQFEQARLNSEVDKR
jgi:hypothetical protein